jgi:hypothetical protein
MAADTPAPFVDGLFRFVTDGEFDDSAVQDSVLGSPDRRPIGSRTGRVNTSPHFRQG